MEKQNPYFNHLLREDGELEGQDEGYITSLEAREESVGCYKRIPRCWVSLSLPQQWKPHTNHTLCCHFYLAICLHGWKKIEAEKQTSAYPLSPKATRNLLLKKTLGGEQGGSQWCNRVKVVQIKKMPTDSVKEKWYKLKRDVKIKC